MSKLLIGSIDLNKIDKSKIVTTGKDGKPFSNEAKYLNVAVWVNDEADKYGNHASIQMGDKDNRIYIGNLKEYQKDNNSAPQSQAGGNLADYDTAGSDDDLPF